ncbi:MAG: hypothetical protein HY216_16705 [Candidatus Rokubacteria bacterium]|nr:hypothetical protein [Candidatus Rokubacteria bacterium]
MLAASTGPAPVEIGQTCQGPIHLLVTDIVMPEMSDREVADPGPIETADPALNIRSSNNMTGRLLN